MLKIKTIARLELITYKDSTIPGKNKETKKIVIEKISEVNQNLAIFMFYSSDVSLFTSFFVSKSLYP